MSIYTPIPSSALITDLTTFSFNDLTQAKGEWPFFINAFNTRLAASKLSWVIQPKQLLDRLPKKFPFSAKRLKKKRLSFRDQLAVEAARERAKANRSTYDDHLGEALAILLKLLPSPSVANAEINGITSKYATQLGKFIHAWTFIKDKYCPSSGEDAELLRAKLVALRDTQGFTTYARDFHLILEQLRLINHTPTDDELNVIVKDSITNVDLVNLCVAPYTLNSAHPFHWESCLARCTNAMKQTTIRRTQADLHTAEDKHDLLGKKSTSDVKIMAAKIDKLTLAMAKFTPTPSNLHALGSTQSSPFCSKCCRVGHRAKACTEKTCSLCGQAIDHSWHDCPNRPDAKTKSQKAKEGRVKNITGAKRTAEWSAAAASEGATKMLPTSKISARVAKFIKSNPGLVMELLAGEKA